MKVENSLRPQYIRQQEQQKSNNKGFNSYKNTSNGSNPNFTGGFDMFLRFLDTNQAWGANAVDLFCMVLPRTLTDFTRGPEAGTETLRREGMGTANHSMVGAYGTLAGMALAAGINGLYQFGKNDIKASSIFADAETMDMQGKIYTDILKQNKENPLNEHLRRTLQQYEVQNAKGEWIKFKDADIEKAVNILEKEIKTDSNKINKDAAYNVRNILMSSANGAENNFRIIAEEGKKAHSSRYSIDYIVENTYKLPKVFSKDSVKETFIKTSDFAQNEFLKALKSMNVKRSLLGIGMASAVGISAQPLNMYLTKKKTGKSGFVGGGAEDKSTGFKIKKSLVAALFGAGVLATIGNPKNLIKDLQFKGFTPTIKQFKFIYGVTIMSRFLSSRNDNELRECSIKDTLGFASWLILGNFVQKLVAQGLDKSLIKNAGKGAMEWIKNSSLMSRDEVLHSALGEKVFKDGKALKYNDLVKLADKATRKKLNILSIAQLAGYAYSALALGAGIPRLNIFITNKIEGKKASKEQPKAQQPDNMYKPENMAFLNEKNFTGNRLLSR